MERTGSTRAWQVARVAAVIAAALGAATAAVAVLEGRLGVPNAAAIYLLAVVAVAVLYGIPAAVATAVGSFVLYDVLFVQPTGALAVADPEEWLNLLLLLVLGVVVGQLAGMQRARAEAAVLRERQAMAQYRVGRELADARSAVDALPAIAAILDAETRATRTWIAVGGAGGSGRVVADTSPDGRPGTGTTHLVLRRDEGDPQSGWVRVHEPRRASSGDPDPGLDAYRVPILAGGVERGTIWTVRPRAAGQPGRGDTRVLAAAADQVGQALERDRLAEEATRAEVARRSEAAKTALLDSVSHDLRTPLATIRAAAGSLMDPAFDAEPSVRRERAAVIDREAERLNRLVANLLDMSRIEAGDLRAHLEPFDLADLVEGTIDRLSDLLAGRPLLLDVPADLPAVQVDEVFVDQVLTNLLENAVRHTAPGIAICLRAEPVAGDRVRLTVEDGGPGVPPEALGRVFDKFTRMPTVGDGARPGSGLGLAVVRGLVEAMGGHVAARSSELGGLAVDVDLLAAGNAPSAAGADAPGVAEGPA